MCPPTKTSPQARADQNKSDGKGQSKGNGGAESKGNGNGNKKGREEGKREGVHKHVPKHKRPTEAKFQSKVPRITHWGIPLTAWPRFMMRPPVIGKHLAKATARDSSGTKRFSKLHLYSHTPEQISAAMLSAPSRSSAKTRAKAIRRFHELISRPEQNPEDSELLFKYFKALDRIFFHGALTGLCYVRVVKKLPNALGDCCTVGTEEFAAFQYRYEAQIRILDVRGRPDYGQSWEERLQQYLDTLLHECVHAVLSLYTCMVHSGCRERERRGVGDEGHLSAWQEIAHAVEAATEEVLGRRFDLARRVGLGGDLAASRKLKMPTREQLARWSLDPGELMREIESRR